MPLAFFLIALIYSAVGFGGGSSYTALLTLTDLSTREIPVVSLACNLVVVCGAALHFRRRGHLDLRLTGPLLAGSVPFSLLGGVWPLRQDIFLGLLGVTLVGSGAALLVRAPESTTGPRSSAYSRFTVGSALGLLSGLVGIGGGVFLAPYMLWRRWAEAKQVAATCSLFILANSAAGLTGQFVKLGTCRPLLHHGWLLLAVAVGGQLGSMAGAGPLPQLQIRRITAVLVVVAGVRVLWILATRA